MSSAEPGGAEGGAGPVVDHVRRNPEGLAPPNQFTHIVGAGDLYFLSGQVARGDDGRVVGPGDMAAQSRQSLDNLSVLLAALDLSWGDVVKLTIYVTDMSRLADVRRVRAEVFAAAGCEPPAITTVGVTSLAAADALIEIEAIAVRRSRPDASGG
jgi:enamine deaminase RidA (YjgF/YER057c/UK114 family)